MTRKDFICQRCGRCCKLYPSFWAQYVKDYISVPEVYKEALAVLGLTAQQLDEEELLPKSIEALQKNEDVANCDKLEMNGNTAICTLQRDHNLKPIKGCVTYPLYGTLCLREIEEAG